MVPQAVVLLAILALPAEMRPREGQATRYAEAIALVSENFDEAAALVVTAARESTFRPEVEGCRVPGIGGMGAFGLSDPNGREFQCGDLLRQALAARERYVRRLDWGRPTRAFGRYIGAKKHWGEARTRARLFWRIRWNFETLTCG